MIASQTFVVMFIMTAIAGSRFYYWNVLTAIVYIGGIIVATEISKLGW